MDNIDLTKVELRDGIYFKREDLFTYHGVNGGKVRSALKLCYGVTSGLVTAGSRKSPQIQIISEIAKYNNLPFIAYTPGGELTSELIYAKKNGAIINQVYMGFNNNLIKHAREKAKEMGYKYIPFGMDDGLVFEEIEYQVQNIPKECKRVVVCVGSGISFIGILKGMKKHGIDKKVLGVVIGANPKKRIEKYLKNNIEDWGFLNDDISNWSLINCGKDYHHMVRDNVFCGIELDEIYEAKCIDYIECGDLFWIIGKGIRS